MDVGNCNEEEMTDSNANRYTRNYSNSRDNAGMDDICEDDGREYTEQYENWKVKKHEKSKKIVIATWKTQVRQ